jgi:hypothetical protein
LDLSDARCGEKNAAPAHFTVWAFDVLIRAARVSRRARRSSAELGSVQVGVPVYSPPRLIPFFWHSERARLRLLSSSLP